MINNIDKKNFKCNDCNFTTIYKHAYEKHNNSKKHAKRIYDINNKNSQVDNVKEIISLKEKIDFLQNKINELIITHNNEIKELMKKHENIVNELTKDHINYIKENATKINNGVIITNNNTNNSFNIITSNFTNAPPLKSIQDHIKSLGDEFFKTLLYEYENKRVGPFLGDLILPFYITQYINDQSVWITDGSRIKFATRLMFDDNTCAWVSDHGGKHFVEKVIKPLTKMIEEGLKLINYEPTNSKDGKEMFEDASYILHKNTIKFSLLKELENKVIDDKIIKWLISYLGFDKSALRNENINGNIKNKKYVYAQALKEKNKKILEITPKNISQTEITEKKFENIKDVSNLKHLDNTSHLSENNEYSDNELLNSDELLNLNNNKYSDNELLNSDDLVYLNNKYVDEELIHNNKQEKGIFIKKNLNNKLDKKKPTKKYINNKLVIKYPDNNSSCSTEFKQLKYKNRNFKKNLKIPTNNKNIQQNKKKFINEGKKNTNNNSSSSELSHSSEED